jgi:hypothetical protein
LDLKSEVLQTTLNVTAVGDLVASQEVSVKKKKKQYLIEHFIVSSGKGTILFTGATAISSINGSRIRSARYSRCPYNYRWTN